MSRPGSPKVGSKIKVPEMDMSLASWIFNIRTVLQFPVTVLTVVGLLVAGSFAKTASRKSLEIIDNIIGRALFFIIPMLLTLGLGWPTGLLAASVSLIFFARINKEDESEGFLSGTDSDSVQTTKMVSDTHRWFVEKILGEMPVAISSDRITTKRYGENDSRTSSSSSMASSYSSDGTK
jgi:predicted membrane protein